MKQEPAGAARSAAGGIPRLQAGEGVKFGLLTTVTASVGLLSKPDPNGEGAQSEVPHEELPR